ncbi:hypothetical protein H8959_009369 [Pygathrix nigripes]
MQNGQLQGEKKVEEKLLVKTIIGINKTIGDLKLFQWKVSFISSASSAQPLHAGGFTPSKGFMIHSEDKPIFTVANRFLQDLSPTPPIL